MRCAAGLPVASLVRFKLFTLDHRLIRGAFSVDRGSGSALT